MQPEYIDALLLKQLLASGTASLYAKKSEVDALNVFPVPDGDTGTNMYLTFQAAVREATKTSSNRTIDVLEAAAYGALMGARGNSGVIVSQFFRGFVKALPGNIEYLGLTELTKGFEGASQACFAAVRQPVEGTILTVIREIAHYAADHADQTLSLSDFLKDIYQHACSVLEKTPEMLPVLRQAGVVDAGGQGLVYFIKGWVQQINGESVDELPAAAFEGASKISNVAQYTENEMMSETDINFQYCTEFILKGKALDLEHIKNNLSPHGDCLLVVGDENTAKIHIHTNNPGIILDFAVRLGDMAEIQINNMVEQSKQRLLKQEQTEAGFKQIGIVAVASGDGLERIFRNLGVSGIVNGGQTMNPSVEDLAKAVKAVNSPEVIILPNNSNIILTANHVQELVSQKVRVVPTHTIPEGLAALLSFSEDKPLAENADRMAEKGRSVITGEVTYAVRSTSVGEMSIKQGDIIGLINGDIVTYSDTPEQVVEAALKAAPNTNGSLITLYYGSDVTALMAQSLLNRLEEVFPDAEIELYYGGQPLYYYLFSVE